MGLVEDAFKEAEHQQLKRILDLEGEVMRIWRALNRALAVLEQIEQDTRNSTVIGHPDITCKQCEMCNKLAREALPRVKSN